MRKTVWAAIGAAAAFFIAAGIVYRASWLCLLLAVICCGAALAAKFLQDSIRFLKEPIRKRAMLLLFTAGVAFVWSFTFHLVRVKPFEALDGTERTITVTATSYPTISGSLTTITAKIHDETLPQAKIRLYDYKGNLDNIEPGMVFTSNVSFRSAAGSAESYSDYLYSVGIYAKVTLKQAPEIIGTSRRNFLYFPVRLAQKIKLAAMEVFPEDIAGLMQGLLTGDKTAINDDPDVLIPMKNAGMMHILAVSGMHVSFLVGTIQVFIKRRKLYSLVCFPLLIIFAAMTGFTPSVVRACVMQVLTLAAPFFKRDSDSLTALAVPLLLLLFLNPYAVSSVGLQLSFAATAGILLVTPRLMPGSEVPRNGIIKRISVYFLETCATTAGALVFTIPISSVCFGYLSLYSVFSNFLGLFAMSCAFTAGYILCGLSIIFPGLMPLFAFFGKVTAIFPRWTLFVNRMIIRLPFAVVSTGNGIFTYWLIFSYAVIFGTWAVRRLGGSLRTPFAACSVIFTLAASIILVSLPQNRMYVSALSVGQGLSACCMDDDFTMVVDCGSLRQPQKAAEAVTAHLSEHGKRKIDLLVLTHLHEDHTNGLEYLLASTEVSQIVMPAEIMEESAERLYEITEAAKQYGTELVFISEPTTVSTDSVTFNFYVIPGQSEVNEAGLFVLGTTGDFDFLITGDAKTETEIDFLNAFDFPDIELLFVGHHGSAYASSEELLSAVMPEYAWISVGTNSYGHPSDKAVTRLLEAGAEVYRTDTNGTLTVSVVESNG